MAKVTDLIGIKLSKNCVYCSISGKSIPLAPNEYYCPFPLNDEGIALVNLTADPRESVNVADDYPEVVEVF
jgi:hypothetical protein